MDAMKQVIELRLLLYSIGAKIPGLILSSKKFLKFKKIREEEDRENSTSSSFSPVAKLWTMEPRTTELRN